MRDDNVIFRQHDGADVCEIKIPGGTNVGVFPVNEVIPGTEPPETYAQRYHEAFAEYKKTFDDYKRDPAAWHRARRPETEPAASAAAASADKKEPRKRAAKAKAKTAKASKKKAPAKKAAKKAAAKAKK